jgi:hypothetical protein
MTYSVVEGALNFTESELIPDLRNRFFNFVTRVKLAIFQDSFQHSKEPKVTWLYVWRTEWVRQS